MASGICAPTVQLNITFLEGGCNFSALSCHYARNENVNPSPTLSNRGGVEANSTIPISTLPSLITNNFSWQRQFLTFWGRLNRIWYVQVSVLEGRDSSVGIATALRVGTVRGSNPGGGETFRTRPDRSWGSPRLLHNGYRVFPGGKAAGTWR